MRTIFLLFPFLAIMGTLAMGQDSLKTTTLREVVVTATRSQESLIEIPRSVSVIGEEAIRSGIYQSLGDLLKTQSGLYVVGAGQTPGTNQNLFMRGANGNQVAVLIDGVRVTDPSTPNSAIDLSEISLANVERIEVIRGAHSTMFGGAAIGGVINVITKDGGGDPGLHGDASWQGGAIGQGAYASAERAHVRYTAKHGLFVGGSIFRQDVKGLDATVDYPANPSFSSDRDDFRKMDGSVSAGFKNDLWDARVSWKRSHQRTEVDNGAFYDDENYYLRFGRNLYHYSVKHQLSPSWTATVLGSVSRSERFYENDSSLVSPGLWDKAYAAGTYFGDLQTHEGQLNFKKGAVGMVAGLGLYREKMSFDNYFFYNDPQYPYEISTSYDTIDAVSTTAYGFAGATYEQKAVKVTGGARISRHTLSGMLVNLELNPSLTFGDLLVYGSLSSGYNAPSLYQLYDPAQNFGAYTSRGNRDLEAERSLSLETGIKKAFPSGSYVALSAYRMRVLGSIEYVYLWEGSTPLDQLTFADDRGDTYLNIAEQSAQGLEVEGAFHMSRKFSLRGNVTFLQTQITSGLEEEIRELTGGHHVQLYNLGVFLNRQVEQRQLVRRPDLTSFVRVSYRPFSTVTFDLSHRYTGSRWDTGFDGTIGPYGGLGRIEVDAYHLVDADLTWHATPLLTVALKVENIFDENYREVVGFRTRGRAAYLKLAARW